MAQALQFTLPGCPNIYYGVELGMKGGEDPEQRGPMRWDLLGEENPDLKRFRKLVAVRQASPALKIGDFLLLDSTKLLAFMRCTDRVADTRIIVANPTDKQVSEILSVRDSSVMNWEFLQDDLGTATVRNGSGTIQVTLPAHKVWVLRPVIADTKEYNPYKRVP